MRSYARKTKSGFIPGGYYTYIQKWKKLNLASTEIDTKIES